MPIIWQTIFVCLCMLIYMMSVFMYMLIYMMCVCVYVRVLYDECVYVF